MKKKKALLVSHVQSSSLICFPPTFPFSSFCHVMLALHEMKCLLSHWSAVTSLQQEATLLKLQLLLIRALMTDKSLLHASLFYP